MTDTTLAQRAASALLRVLAADVDAGQIDPGQVLALLSSATTPATTATVTSGPAPMRRAEPDPTKRPPSKPKARKRGHPRQRLSKGPAPAEEPSEAVSLLEQLVAREGSRDAVAERFGFAKQTLSNVRMGRPLSQTTVDRLRTALANPLQRRSVPRARRGRDPDDERAVALGDDASATTREPAA